MRDSEAQRRAILRSARRVRVAAAAIVVGALAALVVCAIHHVWWAVTSCGFSAVAAGLSWAAAGWTIDSLR